jgi:hypothetical protein
VAARDLRLDRVKFDKFTITGEEDALLATLRVFPLLGDFGISREDYVERRAIGRAVHGLLSWGKLDALFAL